MPRCSSSSMTTAADWFSSSTTMSTPRPRSWRTAGSPATGKATASRSPSAGGSRNNRQDGRLRLEPARRTDGFLPGRRREGTPLALKQGNESSYQDGSAALGAGHHHVV